MTWTQNTPSPAPKTGDDSDTKNYTYYLTVNFPDFKEPAGALTPARTMHCEKYVTLVLVANSRPCR